MLVDSADCDWDGGSNAAALAAENPSSILVLTWSVHMNAADPRHQVPYRGEVRFPRCAPAKRRLNSAVLL
jgi:hypothetical protein